MLSVVENPSINLRKIRQEMKIVNVNTLDIFVVGRFEWNGKHQRELSVRYRANNRQGKYGWLYCGTYSTRVSHRSFSGFYQINCLLIPELNKKQFDTNYKSLNN
ncbi:uncharacterized protein [Euwallacea fornicatus]|uniref:uncharacterized protein n=1 Tax=Euwallacea fornicatus TaxID=995702 RepID=UPI00338DADB9